MIWGLCDINRLFYKIVSDFTYDGLGSIFGGLFKAAMPLLKKGAKTLEREALKTGLDIARDVVQGRNSKQATKSRLKSTGENLLQKAMDTVGPQDNEV